MVFAFGRVLRVRVCALCFSLDGSYVLSYTLNNMPATASPITYPFRPRSTAPLVPGQFWAVPLPDGRFACGRVLQLGGSEIPTPNRTFFGGLLDWIGTESPTADAIAGSQLVKTGVMHIKAITELGGEILGHRPLEADGIELPTLLSAHGGPGTKVLLGADALRPAKREEWGNRPVLGIWGYNFIQQLAAHRLTGG